MTKILRPAYYGAFLLIPQLAAAQPAEEPSVPDVIVHGVYCGPASFAIAGKPGELRLLAPDGTVVLTGTDLTVVNGWHQRCRKGGAK